MDGEQAGPDVGPLHTVASTRLSRADRARLGAIAHAEGKTVADVLRDLVIPALRARVAIGLSVGVRGRRLRSTHARGHSPRSKTLEPLRPTPRSSRSDAVGDGQDCGLGIVVLTGASDAKRR
jgi:hypothetical protein